MSEYKDRDIEALDDEGDYYFKHVSALTAEGLNSKREIAAELAYRDSVIDKMRVALLFYVGEAEAISENMYVSDDATMASIEVLRLDGGKRGNRIIESMEVVK
jgi:hypothetical protein